MPRKKKPAFEFPRGSGDLGQTPMTLCLKFRRASADKVFAHIKQGKCERCFAVLRPLGEIRICCADEQQELGRALHAERYGSDRYRMH